MAKQPNNTTAPTGQIAPFGLRMLPPLREQIEDAARESGRSMNAEIVARLGDSFSSAQATPGSSAVIDDLATQVFQLKSQLLANQWIARSALLTVSKDLPEAKDLIAALERLEKENGPFLKSLETFEIEELFGMKGPDWQKTAKQLIKASAGKPKRGTD